MFASLALAAALTCQAPYFPGMPGVIGGPVPIPPGATPAQIERIQRLNAALAIDGWAYARSAAMVGRPDQFVDTAPRVDYGPAGETFVTPYTGGPQIFGVSRQIGYATRVWQSWTVTPLANGLAGPPLVQRRNQIGMSGERP